MRDVIDELLLSGLLLTDWQKGKMYFCSKKIACAEQFFEGTFLTSIYPPASEVSREVEHLTERKNPHTPVYGVKEFVCLSICGQL